MKRGRTRGCHSKGVIHIRLKDRSRDSSEAQRVAVNIDPGSRTSGYAVTRESEDGVDRFAIGTHQVRHRAHTICAKIAKCRMHTRTRRSRLRHHRPRFDNRRKPGGWPAPSIRHLADDIIRNTERIIALYPVSRIRIETAGLDIRVMQDSGTSGIEYQKGRLHGWQLRAYVLHHANNQCVYCDRSDTRLEVEHIIPRSRGGRNRTDDLTASCAPCNRARGAAPIERFLADDPGRLTRIMQGRTLTNPRDTAHLNIVMPTVLPELGSLGLPLEKTDTARNSWNRHKLNIPKSHVADAAGLGHCLSLRNLPETAPTIAGRARNGRRFKAQIDPHGTVPGRTWRNCARLNHYQRAKVTPPGSSPSQKRFGSRRTASGEMVRIRHHKAGLITGQAVMATSGTRVRISGTRPSASAVLSGTTLLRRDPGLTIARESLMQDARRIA